MRGNGYEKPVIGATSLNINPATKERPVGASIEVRRREGYARPAVRNIWDGGTGPTGPYQHWNPVRESTLATVASFSVTRDPLPHSIHVVEALGSRSVPGIQMPSIVYRVMFLLFLDDRTRGGR
jgi:hypothetical protein